MSQQSLPGLSSSQRANRISRSATQRRHGRIGLRVLNQREFNVAAGFVPVAGVPATRGDCPTQRPCPHVRCRWHLALEDAEHRAGRPGLSSVPRDSRGLTMSQPGHAGTERPGTTLRPIWLELERTCPGWIEVDEYGQLAAIHVDEPRWSWLRLHEGEPLRVVSADGGYASAATWIGGAVRLERAPPANTLGILITRVRGVPSCALDEIDRIGRHSNEQCGDNVGRHRTLVAREVKRALGKAISSARELFGMSPDDLLRGLREMGAGE